MTSEFYSQLRAEVKELRRELNGRLDDLGKSLIDLTRLEGTQHRQGDAIHRIGAQVDGHENRLKTLEQHIAGDIIRWQFSKFFTVLLVSGAASTFTGIAVGITVYWFTGR